MAGLIDKEAELIRLDKEIQRLQKELPRRQSTNNPTFIDKAPADVISKERKNLRKFMHLSTSELPNTKKSNFSNILLHILNIPDSFIYCQVFSYQFLFIIPFLVFSYPFFCCY